MTFYGSWLFTPVWHVTSHFLSWNTLRVLHRWVPIFVSKPSAFVGSYTQDVNVSPFCSDHTYTIWWYNADSFRFCRSFIVPKNLKQCKESPILHTNARSVVSPCLRGTKPMFHAGPYVAADAGKSGGSRGPGNPGIFRHPQIAGEWMFHVMNPYGSSCTFLEVGLGYNLL